MSFNPLQFIARRPAPTGGAFLPVLDALRGIAVLSVFVQHLGDTHLPLVKVHIETAVPGAIAPWIMTVLHHAHWGVDLFFVLSGFSLAQPILSKLSRDKTDRFVASPAWIRAFALRRAARIYPAYLVGLVLVLAGAPRLMSHSAFGRSLAAHLMLLQGYFTPGGLVFIGAAWSLSTEVSFYLVWPWLAPRIVFRPDSEKCTHAHRQAWIAALAIIVGAWAFRAVAQHISLLPDAPPWLFEASQRRWALSRMDQFVLGALAASLHAQVVYTARERLEKAAPALVALALFVLVPAFYLEGSLYREPLGSWPYAVISLATALLVFSAASLRESAAKWLFPPPLRAIGVISYGVFLNHQLAIGVTARWAGQGSLVALAKHAGAALSLSLLIGALSWMFVERPAMEWAAARKR
ncbi:MAG: acyltransferase [Polyangiaceae bacterium]|nr:acyltransferase [Polyangiaceae bacterium]